MFQFQFGAIPKEFNKEEYLVNMNKAIYNIVMKINDKKEINDLLNAFEYEKKEKKITVRVKIESDIVSLLNYLIETFKLNVNDALLLICHEIKINKKHYIF